MHVLVIAEKPSSAAKIAAALAEEKSEEHKRRRVSYYELTRDGDKISVAPAVGHLYAVAPERNARGYPVWDISWKPAHEINEASAFTKSYLDNIADLAKETERVVVATDFDTEGSLIGFNIARFLAPGKAVKRMKFSTLTTNELRDAYENLQDMDTSNALAGEARHLLDWYWGINTSRALMEAIRQAGVFRLLSVGRVQGPALAILAEREKNIATFNPQPYWQLFADIKSIRFEHAHGIFNDLTEAEQAKLDTTEEGVVEKVEQKMYVQPPPHPYDLTTLQIDAYRAFGFAPVQTLRYAQRLYEMAAVSYPRTSSQKLPAKLDIPRILTQLGKHPSYRREAQALIQAKRFKPHEGPKDDPAHPSIHPTGQAVEASPPEMKLYDLIVRRLFATLAPGAKRERQQVVLKLGDEPFVASGVRTLESGWLSYFPYLKAEDVELPHFLEGERVRATRIEFVKKETQPPKRFSSAGIVKKLESMGLGTKATRAEIIETLFKRGYLEDRKAIRLTPLGMAVVEALRADIPEILSDTLTRHFEQEIELIRASKKEPTEVVTDGRQVLQGILEKLREKEPDIGRRLLTGLRSTEAGARLIGMCPTCNKGNLVVRRSKYGPFVGCDQYPNCRQTYPIPKGCAIRPIGRLCEHCRTPIVRVIRKGKRTFSMCLKPGCMSKADWGKGKQGDFTQT